jgi:uncharacterized protein YutE (UPF0331/DUF86 family)
VQRGYEAHVVADAMTSRTQANFDIAQHLIRDAGGHVTSTEVVVFDLLGTAADVEFKALSRLIK